KMSLTFLHVADKKVHFPTIPTPHAHAAKPRRPSLPDEFSDEPFELLKSFLFCSPSGETRLVRNGWFWYRPEVPIRAAPSRANVSAWLMLSLMAFYHTTSLT